jgi:hypothetical protein
MPQYRAAERPLNRVDPHYYSFEKEVLPAAVGKDIAVLGMKSLSFGDILSETTITHEESLRYVLGLQSAITNFRL